MIALPDTVSERSMMVESRAVVIAVGPTAWDDERFCLFGIPLWKLPRAKPSDKVFITKYAGYMAKGPADGKMYRFVNDRDLFAGITMETANG